MKKSIVFCLAVTVFIATVSVAEAQQPKKVFRIGLLSGGGSPPRLRSPTPLEQGLRKLGYVEGQNITIEARYSNGQIGRL